MGDEGRAAGNGCANHPRRLPVGRCPLCKRLVCQECHVRLDGILHCRDCLDERARMLETRGPGVGARVVATLMALVLLGPAILGMQAFLSAAGTLGGRLSRYFAPAMDDGMDDGGSVDPSDPLVVEEQR